MSHVAAARMRLAGMPPLQRPLLMERWVLAVAAVAAASSLFCNAGTHSQLFTRIDRSQLMTTPHTPLRNITDADKCAQACLNRTAFRCLSFDYDDVQQLCHLHNGTVLHYDLASSRSMDHYKGTFQRMFSRLTRSYVPVYDSAWTPLHLEQCAGRCLTVPNCTGFLSRISGERHYCILSSGTSMKHGLQQSTTTEFYERLRGGTLSNFINYGPGAFGDGMSRRPAKELFDTDAELCAAHCLQDATLRCAAFDYIMGTRRCRISSEESVGSLLWPSANIDLVHYERKGIYMDLFWPHLYQRLLGVRPRRSIYRGSPSGCAKSCLEQTDFVCRSFTYLIGEDTCELYSVAAGDFGTLYDTASLPRGTQSHYYELKPMYFCGGTERASSGYISSPNWPYNFVSGQQCSWTIYSGPTKAISIKTFYLALGKEDTLSACSLGLHSQTLPPGIQRSDGYSECVDLTDGSITNNVVLHGHQVRILFNTNRLLSTKQNIGFLLWYEEGPCRQVFNQTRGEFVSPNWPSQYPARANCTWTITAPRGSIMRITFKNFSLEGALDSTDCSRYDFVSVHGAGISSRTFCGVREPFNIMEMIDKLTVTFVSNGLIEKAGFLAAFEIVTQPPPAEVTWQRVSSTADSPRSSSNHSNRTAVPTSTRTADPTTTAAKEAQLLAVAAEVKPDPGSANSGTAFKFQIWGIVSSCLIVILGISVIAVAKCRQHKRRKTRSTSPAWVESHLLHDLSMENRSDPSGDGVDEANRTDAAELLLLSGSTNHRTQSEDDGYISDVACWQPDRNASQQQHQPKTRPLAMSMHESFY